MNWINELIPVFTLINELIPVFTLINELITVINSLIVYEYLWK